MTNDQTNHTGHRARGYCRKAPLRPFRAVEKLTGHPDLPEAEKAAEVLLEMK